MSITNRTAGTWQTFEEEMPPESRDCQIAVMSQFSDMVFFYWWDMGRWMRESQIGGAFTTHQLAKEYDAYCIIQGPWETGVSDECN